MEDSYIVPRSELIRLLEDSAELDAVRRSGLGKLPEYDRAICEYLNVNNGNGALSYNPEEFLGDGIHNLEDLAEKHVCRFERLEA